MFTREIFAFTPFFLEKVAISSIIGGKGMGEVGKKATELGGKNVQGIAATYDVQIFLGHS